MTGQNELNPKHSEDMLGEFSSAIADFEKRLGLIHIKYDEEIEQSMNLPAEALRGMSAEECGIHSYRLATYATLLQKESNRCNRDVTWAEHNLTAMIGKYGDDYGDKYTKFDYRLSKLANGNIHAKALNKILLDCKGRAEQIKFLAGKVSSVSDALKDLANTKRNQ